MIWGNEGRLSSLIRGPVVPGPLLISPVKELLPLSSECDKLLLWPPGSAEDRRDVAGTIWRSLFSVSL